MATLGRDLSLLHGGGGTVLTCEIVGSLVLLCTLQWGKGRVTSENYGE